MNPKRVWQIAAIIALVLVGAVAYLLLSKQMTTPDTKQTVTEQPANTNTGTSASSGKYIDYSSEALATASGRRVLFFHASWCPQCRTLEMDINNSGVPAGISIVKVNYDTEISLRQKYGVTLQTTFVEIDKDGNLLRKFVAYNEPTLEAVKTALEL